LQSIARQAFVNIGDLRISTYTVAVNKYGIIDFKRNVLGIQQEIRRNLY